MGFLLQGAATAVGAVAGFASGRIRDPSLPPAPVPPRVRGMHAGARRAGIGRALVAGG